MQEHPTAGSLGIICHQEAVRKIFLRAMCALQELPGMRVISEKLQSPHSSHGYEEHGLFLFPNTDAGWLATVSYRFTATPALAYAENVLLFLSASWRRVFCPAAALQV